MTKPTDLAFDGTLESFFFAQLEEACQDQRTSLSEDVEAYVVHMLAAHARRPQVAGRKSEALATQFLAARERGSLALREVGDRALYIAGVVPRSLDRTPVDVNYVAGIGEAAYSEIYARKSRLEVFARLAESFRGIVTVLGRMLGADEHGDDLLALYERWCRDADPAVAARLIRAGMSLDAGKRDVLQ